MPSKLVKEITSGFALELKKIFPSHDMSIFNTMYYDLENSQFNDSCNACSIKIDRANILITDSLIRLSIMSENVTESSGNIINLEHVKYNISVDISNQGTKKTFELTDPEAFDRIIKELQNYLK